MKSSLSNTNYVEMTDETMTKLPTIIPNTMPDLLPTHVQLRKYFKTFYKQANFDKMHTFLEWVEMKKPPQNEGSIYNQIKTFEFYQNTAFVAHQEARVKCMSIYSSKKLFAVGLTNGVVAVSSLKTGEPMKKIEIFDEEEEESSPINCVVIEEELIYISTKNMLTSWNYQNEPVQKTHAFEGHKSEILCLCKYKTQFLLSGDESGEVYIWDLSDFSHRSFSVSQKGSVNAMVLTPDGSKIITAGQDPTLKVWNFSDLTLLFVFEGHEETVLTIAISQNGEVAASSGLDKMVKVWDIKTRKEVWSMEGHDEDVNCITFLQDGKAVASGSEDKTIRVWNISKGKLKGVIEGHTDAVKCVEVNPKNALLMSGSFDRSIRAWNVSGFKRNTAFIGCKSSVLALASVPRSPYFLSAGKEKGIKLWCFNKMGVIEELDSKTQGVSALAVDSLGSCFVSGGFDGSIGLWSIDSTNFVLKNSVKKCGDLIIGIAFTKKGDFFVSVCQDQSFKVWDLNLKDVREVKKFTGIPTTIAISPIDNKILIGNKSAEICVWDFNTLKNIHTFKGHNAEITGIQVTKEQRVVSSSIDMTVRIWDLENRLLLNTLESHTKAINCLALSPDHNHAITGSDDKTIRVWNIETGEQDGISQSCSEAVKIMTIHEDFRLVSDGFKNFTLKFLEVDKLRTSNIVNFAKSLNVVVISPSQKLLAIGGDTYKIHLWDMHSWEPITEIKGHVGSILALKFSSNSKRLFSCGDDNSVRIWDIRNLHDIHCIKVFKNFSAGVSGVELYQEEKKVIFASYDGFLSFYELDKYHCLSRIRKHSEEINCITMDHYNNQVYSGGKDSRILVFYTKEIEFRYELGTHDGSVNCLHIYEENRLASGGSDDIIKIWNLKSRTIINVLKGHRGNVMCLLSNSAKNKLFSGSKDKTIQIWDLKQYKRLGVLEGFSGTAKALSINADNDKLFSVGSDKSLRVWNIDDSKQEPFFEGHFDEIFRVVMTPDGNNLISCSKDKNIIVWDINEGKQRFKLKGHQWMVTGLAVTKNGEKLVSTSYDQELRVWDLKKKKVLASQFMESSAWYIDFTHDNKQIIVACCDSKIRVLDMETLDLVKKFDDGHCSNVRRAILTLDGKKMISGGDDKLVIIWNFETTQRIKTLEGHEESVNALAITKNVILSGGFDGCIRVWDFEGKLERTIKDFNGAVTDIYITKDHQKMVFACNPRTIYIYDLNTYTEIKKLDSVNFRVNDIFLTNDEKRLIAAGNRTIGQWNFNTFVFEKAIEGFESEITSQIISPNKRMIIFATTDCKLKVWDFKRGLVLQNQLHKKHITELIMLSDNLTIISASKDKFIIVFNLKTRKIIHKLKAHSDWINALAINNKENLLLSASDDNTIKVWNFPDCILKQTFQLELSCSIYGLTLFSNENLLIAGGNNKKIYLWNLEKEQSELMAVVNGKIMGLKISPDDHFLIVALDSGMIEIWDTHSYSVITQLEMRGNIYKVFPEFISSSNNRVILYYDKLIDCINGELIFNFDTTREISSFYFNNNNKQFYYVTPQLELYKLQNYWLQTYLFEYIKYDSLTALNTNPKEFIQRPMSTYPFFFSFLHLITVFEKGDLLNEETLNEIYSGKMKLSNFYGLDIFMNTPLDLMLILKNTTMMSKFFKLFFQKFPDASFYEKARFLNYEFKENSNILQLMLRIMELCGSDLSIINEILNNSTMPLDSSIYDDSLLFPELDEPILISADSLYVADRNYIKAELKKSLEVNKPFDIQKLLAKKKKDEEPVEDTKYNQSLSTVKAKVICLPNIYNMDHPDTNEFWNVLSEANPKHEIFNNKTLAMIASHMWVSQIRFYFMIDFFVFLFFFVLFNINYIYIIPLRNNIYYDDESVLSILNNVTVGLDLILISYSMFCGYNEYMEIKAAEGLSNYFKSIWSYFCIFQVPLIFIASSLDLLRNVLTFSDDVKAYIKVGTSVSMVCFWLRFLSYFRANVEASSMIRLIFTVIANTKSFVLFMVIFMMTLACSFYVMHTDNAGENPSLWEAFYCFYDSAVGETDDIEDYDIVISSLTEVFSIGSTFIFAIILVNLLVSIIGDIHGENKESASKTRNFELIGIMVDVDSSTITKIVKHYQKKEKLPRYLIQLSNEKHEIKEENPYEALENNLEEKIKANALRAEKIVQATDSKLIAFRESVEKSLEMLNDKLDAGLERVHVNLDSQTKELSSHTFKQTEEIEKIVHQQKQGITFDLDKQKKDLEEVFEKKLLESPIKQKKKFF